MCEGVVSYGALKHGYDLQIPAKLFEVERPCSCIWFVWWARRADPRFNPDNILVVYEFRVAWAFVSECQYITVCARNSPSHPRRALS